MYPKHLALLLIAVLMAAACTQKPDKAPDPVQSPNVLSLHISPDSTAIMDANGQVIARFVEGIKVGMPSSGEKSAAAPTLPGCMCCKNECIAWDSNGNCIKTYRSCTWDFDCGCK